MNPTRRAQKLRALRVVILVAFAAVTLAATVFGVVWTLSLKDADNLLRFQEGLRSLGIVGWLVLFVIQYIHIVIAFIPGGPVQILAGALFGPWGGMLVCLLGCFAATATVFAVVKKYGHRALSFFVDEKSLQKYKFISDAKRLEFLTLLLFFIPGLPKDTLTYIFALTPISLSRFLLLSTLARTPALLTSILMGDKLADGKWLTALFLFLGITVISACGAVFYRRVIAPHIKKTG